jgi:aldehyde dehydrogenase (NAD+)
MNAPLPNDPRSLLHLPRTELLIDGAWRAASDGGTFETLDPSTAERIADVAHATSVDVDRAVCAARVALTAGPWARMPGRERGRLMHRLADALERESERFVALEAIDAGKPLAATRRQDIPAAIDCLAYYAGWADKLHGETIPVRAGAITTTQRVPVGVVAAIVPWNFPLMNACWKLGPALAAGCTVVLKPAELTPLSALALGELALEVGFPPGVLNIIPGFGSTTGQALIEHPGIDKIAFTGSPATGRVIMHAAARHIVRTSLELGGKSANIVFADADLDRAARMAAAGAFFNAGQVCSAGTRLLVEASVHDAFVERLAAHARRIVVGDPFLPGTTMGPIVSAAQLSRIRAFAQPDACEGAEVWSPDCDLPGAGFYMRPTLILGARNEMRVAREEIFGPVACVIPFEEAQQAVSIANDSPYSLAAGVWSSDHRRARRTAEALRAGTVWINTYGYTDARLPWGGCGGDSGIGRDLGASALRAYTEERTFWEALD